ncbi:endo alpha-1,4 polygalactosaminidase [Streptomyces sp. NBC_00879]|nr:endo alpha-1,4 polygalactosaminidase [Streptomyces sp. NBC_00879]
MPRTTFPQVAQLVGDFDLAVDEECAQYDDCAALTPFAKGVASAVQMRRP